MEKQRLDFIDLAKGICILLVVSIHLDKYGLIYFTPSLNNAFFAFRMPLYFVISGLFLSFRDGKFADYQLFVEKKINRLLVPLFFFTLLTNVYNWGCYLIGVHNTFDYRATTFLMVNECFGGDGTWNNGPIFFVAWLFNAYLIIALLNIISHGKLLWMVTLSLFIGIVGYYVQLPLHIDTAMTCCPFVVFGMWLRHKTKFITTESLNLKSKIFYIILSIVLLVILVIRNPQPNLFYCNEYGTTVLEVYLYGIMGTMAVLLFAKSVGRIPFVNYIGRYSIIVLGVHNIFIADLFRIVKHYVPFGRWTEIIVFGVVLGVSTLCIYLFKKYIPKLVAQDDLIYLNWKK